MKAINNLINDGCDTIYIKFTDGEELKLKNIVGSDMDHVAGTVDITVKCPYYDASGYKEAVKTYVLNADCVKYIKCEHP
mgnify:CR=1 FL=1